MSFKARRPLSPRPPAQTALPPDDQTQDTPSLDGEVMGQASPLGADIPPHVWAMLQTAGETAAARLVQILQSPKFGQYPPSAQRGLIELALTRAYGLPIRKALNVNLSTSDSDAVAASLADLASNLPENSRQAVRDALARPIRSDDPAE
jgi:hypothetical protein